MKRKLERNVSLDLLKIIGMFFIVCIHFVGYNKLRDITEGSNYVAMLIVNAICMVAVPCYFLISGYFLCESSFHTKKIAKIWGITLFYSWIFLTIYLVAKIPIAQSSWLKSLFPILFAVYLIHANVLSQDMLWEIVNGRQYASEPLWYLIGSVLGISLLIFILCIGRQINNVELFIHRSKYHSYFVLSI